MPLEIKKRGKIWYASGTVAGQRVRQSLETGDEAIAEQACAALQGRIWKRHIYGDDAVRTFEEAALDYMEQGGEERFVAPLLHHFRGQVLANIKPGDVRSAARKLYPDGSPATMNRNGITPARSIINHAADLGWCQPIRIRQFKVTKPLRTFVDRPWIDAFMKCANGKRNPFLSALALFMFQTGTRISEALNVQWDDVNLQLRTVILQDTKTGPRLVHITREMMVLFANLPRQVKPFRYARRNSVYGVWKRTCTAAGIPYVPPHQAGRHSFGTALHENGVPDKTAADAGGWKSVRQYRDTYVHNGDASKKAADLFDKLDDMQKRNKQ